MFENAAFSRLRAARPEAPEILPRDYQAECVASIVEAENDSKPGVIFVLACSLGKSYTAAFYLRDYIDRNPESRVLVLSHDNTILDQLHEKFDRVLQSEHQYGFYRNYQKDQVQRRFLYATFQTIGQNLEEFERNDFDLVLVDECHHSAAPTYQETIEYFGDAFKVGMTATPDRTDGRGIQSIFGPKVYSIDLYEAMERSLLAKVDYHVIQKAASETVERDSGPRQVACSGRGSTAKNTSWYAQDKLAVREYLRLTADSESETLSKTVFFCSSILHCETVGAALAATIGTRQVEIFHSAMTPGAQAHALSKFRSGESKILLTVDKLNEGVDIPDIETIVFLRRTGSRIIFEQQLGRGLRKTENQDKVIVLDFVDHLTNLGVAKDLFVAASKSTGWSDDCSERPVFNLYIDGEPYKKPSVIESGTIRSCGLRDKLAKIYEELSRIKDEQPSDFLLVDRKIFNEAKKSTGSNLSWKQFLLSENCESEQNNITSTEQFFTNVARELSALDVKFITLHKLLLPREGKVPHEAEFPFIGRPEHQEALSSLNYKKYDLSAHESIFEAAGIHLMPGSLGEFFEGSEGLLFHVHQVFSEQKSLEGKIDPAFVAFLVNFYGRNFEEHYRYEEGLSTSKLGSLVQRYNEMTEFQALQSLENPDITPEQLAILSDEQFYSLEAAEASYGIRFEQVLNALSEFEKQPSVINKLVEALEFLRDTNQITSKLDKRAINLLFKSHPMLETKYSWDFIVANRIFFEARGFVFPKSSGAAWNSISVKNLNKFLAGEGDGLSYPEFCLSHKHGHRDLVNWVVSKRHSEGSEERTKGADSADYLQVTCNLRYALEVEYSEKGILPGLESYRLYPANPV